MFKNYLKIAWRNLWRSKVFSAINILGLTIGLTACFFIFLYVRFELSYDQFHSHKDNIYQVTCDIKTPSETLYSGSNPWTFAPNMQRDFPEIAATTRLSGGTWLVKYKDAAFQEENTLFADSTLFDVFDFKLLTGNKHTALAAPYTVVISQKTAKKYFGKEDPVGKVLLFGQDQRPTMVTGVMEDAPENSQIKPDMFVSMTTLISGFKTIETQWGNFGAVTYLLLKPGVKPASLESKFADFIERHNGPQRRKAQMLYTLKLSPFSTSYLHNGKYANFEAGDMSNVYIFSIIAIFILVIAGINFVNLTTARSVERAKEIGIRKVVGASRTELVRQFIGECVIMCLLAFACSVLLFSGLLPTFNLLAGKTISSGFLPGWSPLLLLLGTAVGIGLLAGSYPAFVLSAFKPIVVLKGRFANTKGGVTLRKGLVVAQFTISIVLIIGTLVVYKQMYFMKHKNLGFSKDQMLVMNTEADPATQALHDALQSLPQVKSVSISSTVPGSPNAGAYSEIQNKQGEMQVANLDLYFVDYDYISQYKMKVVAGRAFSKEFAMDTTEAMVINETAARQFGYNKPEEAIGRKFNQWGRQGTIIGVVQDFHFRSLQKNIAPLTMRMEPREAQLLSVNLVPGNITASVSAIESKWKEILPNRPFNYFFMDEFFDRQYRSEERFGTLFFYFAILAIVISCLGLLGLASYSAMQRTREIGIRKVMGASVSNIIGLLSRDFLKQVIIAFVIAVPIAWFCMHRWVDTFAYRSSISWWIFAISGALALFIAMLTISLQALKAALADPVESMRTE